MSKPGEPMTIEDVFVHKAQSAFKVGDVVRLKSGGSMMTVAGSFDASVTCVWHTAEGVGCFATYPPEALVLYNEPKQDTPEIIGTDPAHSDWRKKHGLA